MSKELQENTALINANLRQAELVSALVDGQLPEEEFGRTLDYLGVTDEARQAWDTYHLVGDAMRSAAAPLRAHDPLFIANLRRNMASEEINLVAADDLSLRTEGQKDVKISSANDAWWLRVAGLMSVLVLSVLAWQGIALMGQTDSTPTLAQANDDSNPVMIRDPQLDALLAAHRQLGGASALQMPTGFLRNATFNEGNR
jgi:sigma-E factor negative regulatory protein RseA